MRSILPLFGLCLALVTTACGTGPQPGATGSPAPSEASPKASLAWRAPAPDSIPSGPEGDAIRRGLEIVSRTYETLPDHVGNRLHCSSCHLGNGTVPNAGPFVGVTGRYPNFSRRYGHEIDLKRRVNDCFERSMHGKPLDEDSADLAAVLAYMEWLSQDVPPGADLQGVGMAELPEPEKEPDAGRGETVYTRNCSACHGKDGAGRYGSDGRYIFPAVWGADSYNSGAGMSRPKTAAAFASHNMPLGKGETLTVQEAWDVAEYLDSQPRPKYRVGPDEP